MALSHFLHFSVSSLFSSYGWCASRKENTANLVLPSSAGSVFEFTVLRARASEQQFVRRSMCRARAHALWTSGQSELVVQRTDWTSDHCHHLMVTAKPRPMHQISSELASTTLPSAKRSERNTFDGLFLAIEFVAHHICGYRSARTTNLSINGQYIWESAAGGSFTASQR